MKFEIPNNKLAEVQEWENQQNAKAAHKQNLDIPNYGAIGGGFTYKFCPTSLGLIIKVRNEVTGDEIDVTDYHLW